MKLFNLVDEIYIIEGYPFLYLKEYDTLILGDLHLGQENYIIQSQRPTVSNAVKILRHALERCVDHFNINTIVLNGDIKHVTRGVQIQEKLELNYVLNNPIISSKKIILVKGNHDPMISLILPKMNNLNLRYSFELKDILITHGDRIIKNPESYKYIVLSHEHPSYVLRGSLGERVKLKSFAHCFDGATNFILLPAAGDLTGGTSFPPRTIGEFLSPTLKNLSDPLTISMYPFDETIGTLVIPPISVSK